MSSLKVTFCAGAALAVALAPAAPAGYAADGGEGGGVTVTPSSPAPGGDVTLRMADCAERTAVAVSEAFDSDVRLSPAAEDGGLVGSSRIRSTTQAGAYAVRVTCGDAVRDGTVTVAEQRRPAAPASPVAPVDAGGGGSSPLAAQDARDEARPAPPGTAHTVTGLVLAAIAAVAVALRGVRSRSGRTG
ncbi:hypothetical protein [Streptomyces lancefieldiae]|uniref:Secreted protein n=1 Tax=Streptomyces lancefieldiae TaxID=3075520 RepID=A0ABU3AT42_9ACTN|nr:hypothetical protein [Streptomyces sp. DSM 40712]MDT0613362.1 hypothetical protein [Streptomyces sp. DSM 40712]